VLREDGPLRVPAKVMIFFLEKHQRLIRRTVGSGLNLIVVKSIGEKIRIAVVADISKILTFIFGWVTIRLRGVEDV
jgi:hypothetical protein